VVIVVWLIRRPLRVTVRPMLRDRCLSVLSMSVTLVYRGQTVGWIKMPLGTEVILDPGDIVLDGIQGTAAPHFSVHVYCGQTVAHLSNC